MGILKHVWAVAAAAALTACAGGAQALGVGDAAPDFGGTWYNAPSTTLADLRGHAVFIEFLRTW